MGTSYKEFREEMLKDPEVKKEYDALEPEYAIIRAMLDARKSQGLTQQELAERTGIKQGDISKLERGNGNPFNVLQPEWGCSCMYPSHPSTDLSHERYAVTKERCAALN